MFLYDPVLILRMAQQPFFLPDILPLKQNTLIIGHNPGGKTVGIGRAKLLHSQICADDCRPRRHLAGIHNVVYLSNGERGSEFGAEIVQNQLIALN